MFVEGDLLRSCLCVCHEATGRCVCVQIRAARGPPALPPLSVGHERAAAMPLLLVSMPVPRPSLGAMNGTDCCH